ncbi:Geranylgeranyl transferase type-2 subunit alpha 1 [Nosema granulosis]|uniref:Geranylgeranyl transferase type-2 subunit alpha n=1 Tax=Nosema granulosis TaxID=83296 RepID=A0A9P6KZ29_9MICR|nr:Geranylgeranyl transferase type-2 subunit alpha 1 [Nosema granulosis]
MIIHNVKEGECIEDKKILETLQDIFLIENPTEKATALVPIVTEDYAAWNYLKRVPEQRQLGLTETAIENNPKSYQAWYHRLYVYRQDPVLVLEKIQREIKLISLLLEFDSRNFHCWNYKHKLMAILRNLINAEEDLTDKEVEKIVSSEVKVYPCGPTERCEPHEETIRLLDQRMRELAEVGKDISNYSYLHFHGDFDACAAVFTDPFDEGIWMFFHKKREEFFLQGGFYVRKYRDRLEVHFKEPFSGKLALEFEGLRKVYNVQLPTRVYKIIIPKKTDSKEMKVNNKVLKSPSDVPLVSLNNMYSFAEVLNENLFLSSSLFTEIYELEPNCVLNFLFNINSIQISREIINFLISKDPIRRKYYENIENDLYQTFI